MAVLLLWDLNLAAQTKTLVSKAAQTPITIDGNAADWAFVAPEKADTITYGKENWTGQADFGANFKTAWDHKNLYFYADITDDVKIKNGTFYLVDNIEIWLDVNHSQGAAMDGVDDIKFRINRDSVLVASCPTCNELGTFPWQMSLGMKGMTIKQNEGTAGWSLELAIPWDSIQSVNPNKVAIGEGTEIGFNVYFCDQDDQAVAGTTRTKLFWKAGATANPVDFGTLVLSGTPPQSYTKMEAPAAQNPIVIDGNPADWAFINGTEARAITYGLANWTGLADFSASFKTAWDKTNFYFYADITDDIKIKDGTFYLVDNLEIWLDVNNSKGTAMDGVDDIKLRINRDNVLVASCPTCNELGTFPWQMSLGMKGMTIKQNEGTAGWSLELAIPWDSIQSVNPNKVAIGEGTEIGFNVYFCDQDDPAVAGTTRTKLNWIFGATANPVDFGTLVLKGSTGIDPTPAGNGLNLLVYPNPANGILNISANEISGIEIYNTLGSKVYSDLNVKPKTARIDVSEFAKGNYILRVTDRKGKSETQKFIIN